MNKILSVTAIFIVCLFTIFARSSESASFLEFEGIPHTDITSAGDILPLPASVLTDQFIDDGVIFGLPGVSTGVAVVQSSGNFLPSSGVNTVAGLDASGFIPGTRTGNAVGALYFDFVSPGTFTPSTTDNVEFTIGDVGGDLDIYDIRAYDLTGTLIYDQHFESVDRFLVTIPIPGINSIEIDFTGIFGYTLDDLFFNTPLIVSDSDEDGILDDGDGSGFIGDTLCTGSGDPLYPNCDDNCIDTSNPDQSDLDSDGVGDACDQCANTPAGTPVDDTGCAITTFTPGDCNGDALVDAGDLTALVLEIFDLDGNLSADAPGGSFEGTVGCDGNEDNLIDAGDLSCTVLLIFNGPGACGS